MDKTISLYELIELLREELMPIRANLNCISYTINDIYSIAKELEHSIEKDKSEDNRIQNGITNIIKIIEGIRDDLRNIEFVSVHN